MTSNETFHQIHIVLKITATVNDDHVIRLRGFIPLRGSFTNFLWRFYMVSYMRY